MPPWLLAAKQAWLVVPLIMLDQLIGFVVLARPHVRTELNWEVRDLLKTASRQAASYLAQMNAAEALLETRKFDAFNKMSAFVVHDLKNIVTQLSLMMQNARRLQDNPEFRQDMLTTVENSLEKMRQLILQLREGETPVGVLCGVDLAPVAQRLQALSVARGRPLELHVGDGIVVAGHNERIARVLGHLVQNAFDATPAPGRVWLSIERDGPRAKVVVGDTGHGMTAEFVQTRLFKPFHTTKQGGMGIGAYESDQYIRELGGRIVVDSEAGRGTVITVQLPLFESRQPAELETSTAK
jgi:putative PEP-CTERM system histidine kinase